MFRTLKTNTFADIWLIKQKDRLKRLNDRLDKIMEHQISKQIVNRMDTNQL